MSQESRFKTTRLKDMKVDLREREICNLDEVCKAIDNPALLLDRIRSHMLAYGFWALTDGRTILFNRHYIPMFESTEDGWRTVKGCPHYDSIANKEWFYDDGDSEQEKRRKSIGGMRRLGLIE